MEAVTMFGGAVLAPLFQTLLDSLKYNDMFTFAGGNKVLQEVSKWKPMLETIFAELDDAEELQVTDGVVRSWFSDLRDLAYDVDDVLDELITQDAQRKFHSETEITSTKVEKLLGCGLSLRSSVKFSAGMVSKVKNVSQRLEDMKTRMDLPKNVGGRNKRVNEEIARPLPMSSLAEPKVHGREKDHKAIVDMMKSEDGDGGISVICIVGMGGVGKSTLAQMVYNDKYLQVDFKAWVSIGEDFDLITVTKTIVQCEGGDLDSLQTKLRQKLFGKKFLVVLDDLWSEDYNKWTRFYCSFVCGAPGSRIIITTRSNEVSKLTSGCDGYTLQTLSIDDSLCLFARHALGKEDFSDHMDLKEVGREIVKRCNGLPLALKAVGGILRGKPEYNVWNKLLQNKLWAESSKILPALRLSYFNLPPHLKRCFSYCAIFPDEYEFARDDLILLWLAEGFVQDLSRAYDCFDELFARSLFQKSAKDTSVFLMHDLIRDLARSLNGGISLNLDEEKSSRESYAQVRHLAYNRDWYDVAPRFNFFQHTKSLRTILALPIFEKFGCHISSKILDDWIPKLKLLRLLSLSGYMKVELPKSVSALQHLRFLNLCGADFVTLPTSINKLFNLQVLILRNCKNLRKLPEDFINLINLQCVDLRGTNNLEEMPLHVGKFLKLHILTKFIVGKTDGGGIQELLKIPNLQGYVHLKELQNVVSRDCLGMKDKEKIDSLTMEWSSDFNASRDEENEKQVLEALQPQKNVARMSIKSYGGREFPLWFGNESFKMTVVEIHDCRNVSWLPPLGRLPLLKELSIQGMSAVKQVGVEFYGVASSSSSSSCFGVFPSLEILNFEDMISWKLWRCFENVEYEGRVFPRLKKLGITNCPKLVGDLPKSLDSLEELAIEGCTTEFLKCMPNLKSLTKLNISHIEGGVSFNVAFPETFKSLQELEVHECGVKHLWENGTNLKSLGGLKLLQITYCANLVSLVEGEEGIFPPNLQLLRIWFCHNLERLPNQLHTLKSLTDLSIWACGKLTTFGDMPENVKQVCIRGCDSVERVGEGIMVEENGKSYSGQTSCIERLCLGIGKAEESLIIPSNLVFPTSLRDLELYEGYTWETELLRTLQLRNHFSHLSLLYLQGCLLESFPANELPIPTLKYLRVKKCKKLRSLPYNLYNLTNLEFLNLLSCPNVEHFPERGMPPNISILQISCCDTLDRRPLSEWRLNQLPHLQYLTIKGAMETVYSFPHHSLPLPTSLIDISIDGFKNLKSISSGIQTLTSLRVLAFRDCPKLQYLPKGGLPPSLGCLRFGHCRLMRKQCNTREGKYWTRLAHIPYLDCDSTSDSDSDSE